MITIGLMSDPGLPVKLAERVVRRVEGPTDARWRFVAHSKKLPLDENGEIPLGRYAGDLQENNGWDAAIYLTELPLWRDGRPILFEVTGGGSAALVSLPALGAVRVVARLEALLETLVPRLLGDEPDGPSRVRAPLRHAPGEHGNDAYVLARGRAGTARLITGMIRSNRPGRLIRSLSNALATALATGTFGVFYASIWNLADALHPLRLTAIAALVISALTAWLIAGNSLWNTRAQVPDTGRRRRDNAATAVTIGISALLMYLLLLLALLASAAIIIDADFLASELDHPVGAGAYVRLSALAAALGMMAGAVGSNFDHEESIREATYSRREVERRKLSGEQRRWHGPADSHAEQGAPMGKLIYGDREIELEDRTLAHVKVVMLTKLRRSESFAFTVEHDVEHGSGRCTLWIHPGANLEFHFYGSRRPDLNREWVENLLMSANTPEGMRVLPEHPEE